MKRLSFGLALGVMLLAAACTDLGPGSGVLEIQAAATELVEGETLTLGATVRGQLVSPQSVSWSCDDSTTLHVAEGLVIGLAPGVAWVWAQQGVFKDSVAVVVHFDEIGMGEIALRFRGSSTRRYIPGRATIYENAETRARHTVIGGWEDDGGLFLRMPGVPEPGAMLIAPFQVNTNPFYLSGDEGVYLTFEESRGQQFWVAVNDSPLEITAVPEMPAVPGLTGSVEGRVSVETAGLLVSYSPGGVENIEPLTDTTVVVFAEFVVPLEYKLSGRSRLDLWGGPYEAQALQGSGHARPVEGGLALRVVTSHPDLMRGRVEADVWVPEVSLGASDVGEAPPAALTDPNYGTTSWATLHVSQDTDDAVNAYALSRTGAVTIAEYQAPQGEAYGLVRGMFEVNMDYYDPVSGMFSGESTRMVCEFAVAVMP
jgi:hypothetical protein